MQDVQASELVSVRREIEEQSMLPSPRHVLQKGAVVSRMLRSLPMPGPPHESGQGNPAVPPA